ncbi:hypothetical protein [Streptomyces sp. NPDC127038]|uniref:hypothetical protein n=1 Tax=Streptomyces sp. NPDC127038 TaxID=3347114 RepID=UPI0036695A90
MVTPLDGRLLPGTPESTGRRPDRKAALWPVLGMPRGARAAAHGLAWLLLGGAVARYAVWIVTAAVGVFLLLAPVLRASPTCRPVVP